LRGAGDFAQKQPKEQGVAVMWIFRSPIGPGHAWAGFERPATLAAGLVALALTASVPASAQKAGNPEPSPVAPGDLSKPVFDTRKPVYDPGLAVDKAANAPAGEVEGRPITMGDVGDAIRALPPAMANLPFETIYPSMLEQLIRTEALAVRAQNQGIDEDPAVRRRVRAATDRVLADEYLHREGAKAITETMLLDRYKRDYEGKPGAEEVHARIIMVPTEREANDVIAEIHGGADFATVAKRASKDPTASTGGDLGFVTRDGLNAEMGAVVFASAVGQLVPYPVRAVGSWFVVKVEERRRRATPSFAEVHEELSHALLQEVALKLAQESTVGLKVRIFDLLGRDTEPYTRPAR
jgi:peptidyl-prolyl cis-trans isomerase C